VKYLTVEEICGFNAGFIGPGGLCDRALLESAVMRPQQGLMSGDVYPDLHSKAAALVHSLIRNHAFVKVISVQRSKQWSSSMA
jgi:death-on-curing protein